MNEQTTPTIVFLYKPDLAPLGQRLEDESRVRIEQAEKLSKHKKAKAHYTRHVAPPTSTFIANQV